MLNEIEISRAIIEEATADLLHNLDVEVAIVGGGPSGLIAGFYLARQGHKVAIFERKLSTGGGVWGGGMLFPKIVVQEQAKKILDEFGIKLKKKKNLYASNSVEVVAKLTSRVIDSGVQIFNGISAEDVLIRRQKVCGIVINWSAVEIAQLHVDPLTIGAKFVIDATGHAAELCHIVQNKVGKLNTPSGKIEGEKSMWADEAERQTIENTKEVYPGLFVTGMAANAVFGGPRMGPIFGGMFLSGEKVARLIHKRLF
ncbi:ribose 1,5-bisphosphate isomerase [Candidatus Desantisbacteria bacterium CG1_02_38_46]|uniref:Thiamine thiazole synthase n=3 Tax=unclassified Candidatus Desantisiibacteriota TaxID=3106372 RepID=A0A2H9P9J3_9BACT|nr:MAG: ribose 1,5-bisphosphate isomerase [Candidatus Desantisbacteria bacterium CG1_02_38_46]PIU51486.1 MAG: ribose 1,5-bisphosphate isomerase [Candidatus Desantisbacteria bacterium CG07_land_8_20_14_0_80_39_15]PIZ14954.1 MAG: ribose 1,5-bisphosphate isomerase [Candidatus Desantisbacteria bacterium CG_4_10_14_0_8_um_filter_39_17]